MRIDFLALEQVLALMRDRLNARTTLRLLGRSPAKNFSVAPLRGEAAPPLATPLLAACVLLGTDDLAPIAREVLAYLKGIQRDTGRVDLANANPDSGADTAFVVQNLAPALGQLRSQQLTPAWADVRSELETFLRAATLGLLNDGGIHTPNHRWAMDCALRQAAQLFEDLAGALHAYGDTLRAETPDCDAEGFFIERSLALYDSINTRSILLSDALEPWPQGRDAALRCLRRDLDLLHFDGSGDTVLSRRQDRGSIEVCVKLAPSYLLAGKLTGDETLAAAGVWLMQRALEEDQLELGTLVSWVRTVKRTGTKAVPAFALGGLDVLLPLNGLWRYRSAPLSFTAAAGTERIMGLVAGAVRVSGVSISRSYMGRGRFVPQAIRREGNEVVLESIGWHPKPHGYFLPLNRPVGDTEAAFEASRAERGLRELPAPDLRVRMKAQGAGVVIALDSLASLEKVPAHVAIDLPVGGEYISGDTAFEPTAGQVILHRAGAATWRVGNDALVIEGGAEAHRTYQMRDTTPVPAGHVRVLINLETPIKHTVVLRHVAL